VRSLVEAAVQHYPFLQPRHATHHNRWQVSTNCPRSKHVLRRRGATWLGEQGRWAALDTLSFHALRVNRWIGCYYREYPMAWGAIQGHHVNLPPEIEYVLHPPRDFARTAFWRWVAASTSWNIFTGQGNPLANSYAIARTGRSQGGLPVYPEIALQRTQDPLRFAVAVRQSGRVLATTDAASVLRAPVGGFSYQALGRQGVVTVSTAAQTFFAPPHSPQDWRAELPTLFRPYWQARRVAVSPAEAARARSLP
jgi:hypothetical protein